MAYTVADRFINAFTQACKLAEVTGADRQQYIELRRKYISLANSLADLRIIRPTSAERIVDKIDFVYKAYLPDREE